jgi:hypothetical protein
MSLTAKLNKLGQRMERLYVERVGPSTLKNWVKTVAESGTVTHPSFVARVIKGVEYRASYSQATDTHVLSMQEGPDCFFRASWSDLDDEKSCRYDAETGWRHKLYAAYQTVLKESRAPQMRPLKIP